MKNIQILKPVAPIKGVRTLPGSKSIANRAIICALLRSEDSLTILRNLPAAEDVVLMMKAIQKLGSKVEINKIGETASIKGALRHDCGKKRTKINAGKAGTVARFLLPILSSSNGRFLLDGDKQLRERPIFPLVNAIRILGGDIKSKNRDEVSLPLLINGKNLNRGSVNLTADVSSQFASGLLLEALNSPLGRNISIDESSKAVSIPYLKMTLKVMEYFGARTHSSQLASYSTIGATPIGLSSQETPYTPLSYDIEPDATSAGYFWAAAAITGGRFTALGLNKDSIQGDIRFTDILEAMGCEVDRRAEGITVKGTNNLIGGNFYMKDISDNVPTLAIVASFANSPTRIYGVGFIRNKESNRIDNMVTEMRKMGIDCYAEKDGMTINPSKAPYRPTQALTYKDHRIAMAMSLAGLKIEGMSISNPRCVNKSFPDFFKTLSSLYSSDT